MVSSFFQYLVSIVALGSLVPRVVDATACIAFDSNFNLYAFGFGGKDFQLGTQDAWSSSVTPKDITSNGRPPFDGKQTTCYLSQFFNAIYVLDGDESDSSAVHIFNAGAGSWSTQKVQPGGPNPGSLVAILDHDTNTFYAVDNGTLSFMDLGQLVVANNTPVSWVLAKNTPYGAAYQPTMALAQNHIFFIGTPNAQPATAEIFVIHFSFFQSTSQGFPNVNGGSPFPETHGQATSFFIANAVQENVAYIPDDGSATYIFNVEQNNTVTFAGPTDKSESTYAASLTALVQLTQNGSISFLPFDPSNPVSGASASWSKIDVQGLPALTTTGSNGSTSGSNSTTSGTGSKPSNGTNPSSSSGSGSNTNSSNGDIAISLPISFTMFVAVLSMILTVF
ncbi:hypothetical protein Clacol_004739 [Clathrus columnatus]|uniref:Uncharacterized protein n=1 Tax=Clathrus columnatus TaxID=1419009 RepID=A0AAV5ACY5_9AGAM|nr:hypothetical protein Clacol_004739 [Clathrus columnatus]